MKTDKLCGMFCVLLVALAGIVYADDSELKDAKTEGKQLFSDIGTAFKKAGRKIGTSIDETVSDVRAGISKQCEGTWTFTNGKTVTTIVCKDDGHMLLKQSSGFRNRSWQGSYEAVSGVMTFKLSEARAVKKQTWKILFSISQKKEMRITSDDIPDDYNGFDFSNPAVFIKQ